MRYLWPEHMCITAGPGGREETAQVSTSARLTLPCLALGSTPRWGTEARFLVLVPHTLTRAHTAERPVPSGPNWDQSWEMRASHPSWLGSGPQSASDRSGEMPSELRAHTCVRWGEERCCT